MATSFSGGSYVNTTFTGAVRSDIQKNIAAQMVNAGWVSLSGATGVGTGPGNVGVVTLTIASPCVVTFTSHGFLGGERIILQTTGALPTGLSVNTVFFVKFIDANTFNLATTLGGTNIVTTGSQSGVHTLNTESHLLQSATQTNVTNPINVRLKDARGNCLQVSIENTAGTVAGASPGFLLPAAAKTFQILASKYRFECFTPGASLAREFVMAGMLNVPTNLTGITDHGYMLANSLTDISTTVCASIRTTMSLAAGTTGGAEIIWSTNLLDLSGNTGTTGRPQLILPNGTTSVGLRWSNDGLNAADVLLSAGLTGGGDEGKIKGQFYDMLYIGAAFAVDSTDTFSIGGISHTWWNLSNNISTGGVWVATS